MGLSRVQTLPALVAGQTNMHSRHLNAGNQTPCPVHDDMQHSVHEASAVREGAAASPGPGAQLLNGRLKEAEALGERLALVQGAAGTSWQGAAGCPPGENKVRVSRGALRAVGLSGVALRQCACVALLPPHARSLLEAIAVARHGSLELLKLVLQKEIVS